MRSQLLEHSMLWSVSFLVSAISLSALSEQALTDSGKAEPGNTGSKSGRAASVQQNCKIYGRVTDSTDNPLEGAEVNAYVRDSDAGRRWVTGSETNSSGEYELLSLEPETYYVSVRPPYDRYLFSEAYSNHHSERWWFDINVADPVRLSLENPEANIDFRLERGATVSGQVRDASSEPISDVAIDIVSLAWEVVGVGRTNDTGGYVANLDYS